MKSLSLIIPAYNEAARLPPTLVAASGNLRRHFAEFEIIVVDDGSTDGTASAMRELSGQLPQLRVIEQGRNLGKGAAIRRGALSARFEVVAQTDADLPYDLDFLRAAAQELAEGADLAIGARDLKQSGETVGYPWYRRLTAWGFSALVVRDLVRGIRDTQCGIKCFRREAARRLYALSTLHGFAFDVEILFLAQRLGMRIARLPVQLTHSAGSSVRLVRDSLAMWREVRRIVRQRRAGWYDEYRWDGQSDRACRCCGGDLAKSEALWQRFGRRLMRCSDCGWMSPLPLRVERETVLDPAAILPPQEGAEQILQEWLRGEKQAGCLVLDIGPEGQPWGEPLEASGHRVRAITLPLGRIDDQLGPLPGGVPDSGSFERVLVHGVLEGIVEPGELCRRLACVMSPAGRVLLVALDAGRGATRRFESTSRSARCLPQLNYPTPDGVSRLLRGAGFEIIAALRSDRWFGVLAGRGRADSR